MIWKYFIEIHYQKKNNNYIYINLKLHLLTNHICYISEKCYKMCYFY